MSKQENKNNKLNTSNVLKWNCTHQIIHVFRINSSKNKPITVCVNRLVKCATVFSTIRVIVSNLVCGGRGYSTPVLACLMFTMCSDVEAENLQSLICYALSGLELSSARVSENVSTCVLKDLNVGTLMRCSWAWCFDVFWFAIHTVREWIST